MTGIARSRLNYDRLSSCSAMASTASGDRDRAIPAQLRRATGTRLPAPGSPVTGIARSRLNYDISASTKPRTRHTCDRDRAIPAQLRLAAQGLLALRGLAA